MITPFLLLALWLPCAPADGTTIDVPVTASPAEGRMDYLESVTQLFTPVCQALCRTAESALEPGPECEARCLAGVVSPDAEALQAQRQLCSDAGGVWPARMPGCAESLQAGLELTGDSRVSEVFAVIQAIHVRCSAEALCQADPEDESAG